MKTPLRISLAVAAVLLVGCSASPVTSSKPAPGDVAPRVTFQAPARAVTRGLERVSMPQSPREVFVPRVDIPVTTEQDVVLNVPAGAPGKYVVPVDSVSDDAFLYLLVSASTEDEVNAALRDIVVTSPEGAVLNALPPARKVKNGVAPVEVKPAPSLPLAGHATGEYTVQVGAVAAQHALLIKAQQPASTLKLTASPSTAELLLGNDASVDVTLADGAASLDGAHVVGHLVDPAMNRTVDVPFTAVGGGVYRATGLGAAFGPASTAGVWHVFVEADGKTAAGTTFRRFASTAFDFAVPTAQIVDASTTRVVRDDRGRIAAFEVDVTIESKASDRYEVSALLTGTGADGLEHPLVRAQTAEVLDPGTQKLTLRFDAGLAGLAGIEGDYTVRDVLLYSQGVNAPMHRVLAGHGQRFAGVRLPALATPLQLPPRVEEMRRNGLL